MPDAELLIPGRWPSGSIVQQVSSLPPAHRKAAAEPFPLRRVPVHLPEECIQLTNVVCLFFQQMPYDVCKAFLHLDLLLPLSPFFLVRLVITIILAIVASSPELHSYSGNLVFRSGTCIKKVFYPDETRFSEDLDFMGLTID